jgi:polar amino acid transport system ATP-binding protein
MSDATPLVTVHQVHKAFGDNAVLTGLSLDLAQHEVVCLIGPSGSGKSTLLRCIDMLEPVTQGRITVDGVDITIPSCDENAVRRDIGMVFQGYNLFPHLSVVGNITLAPIRVRGTGRAEARERALELLARFDLADKADAYPDQLSGGQQQRVAIIRALAMDPKLLLLDEITSALDPELVGEVLNLLRDLAIDGMTMLVATHEMSFAREVATRVCFLDGGVIVEEGPPSHVLDTPTVPRTQQFLDRVINPMGSSQRR